MSDVPRDCQITTQEHPTPIKTQGRNHSKTPVFRSVFALGIGVGYYLLLLLYIKGGLQRIEMTLSTYAHALPSMQQDAADR